MRKARFTNCRGGETRTVNTMIETTPTILRSTPNRRGGRQVSWNKTHYECFLQVKEMLLPSTSTRECRQEAATSSRFLSGAALLQQTDRIRVLPIFDGCSSFSGSVCSTWITPTLILVSILLRKATSSDWKSCLCPLRFPHGLVESRTRGPFQVKDQQVENLKCPAVMIQLRTTAVNLSSLTLTSTSVSSNLCPIWHGNNGNRYSLYSGTTSNMLFWQSSRVDRPTKTPIVLSTGRDRVGGKLCKKFRVFTSVVVFARAAGRDRQSWLHVRNGFETAEDCVAQAWRSVEECSRRAADTYRRFRAKAHRRGKVWNKKPYSGIILLTTFASSSKYLDWRDMKVAGFAGFYSHL